MHRAPRTKVFNDFLAQIFKIHFGTATAHENNKIWLPKKKTLSSNNYRIRPRAKRVQDKSVRSPFTNPLTASISRINQAINNVYNILILPDYYSCIPHNCVSAVSRRPPDTWKNKSKTHVMWKWLRIVI